MTSDNATVRVAGLGLILLTFTPPAFAQSLLDFRPADQAAMEQCLNSAAGRGVRAEECIGFVQDPCRETEDGRSTAGSVACIAREHDYWDRLLNQSYRAVRDTLSEQRGAALRDLQRQWLAWREARCAFEAQLFEGGTYANVAANQCFTQETARRALDLSAMLVEAAEPYLLED